MFLIEWPVSVLECQFPDIDKVSYFEETSRPLEPKEHHEKMIFTMQAV